MRNFKTVVATAVAAAALTALVPVAYAQGYGAQSRSAPAAKADVRSGAVKTVQGQPLTIDASPAGVSVNGAKVIKTDVLATNGVIHVIDRVVLPN